MVVRQAKALSSHRRHRDKHNEPSWILDSGATHHLIGEAQFELMKPAAFLINTARGPIVDEAALVEALQHCRISGAGLDVFENEPAVHPGLLECDNAVLVPHLGSATVETRSAMARLAAHNAVNVLAGVQPPTPIPVPAS